MLAQLRHIEKGITQYNPQKESAMSEIDRLRAVIKTTEDAINVKKEEQVQKCSMS